MQDDDKTSCGVLDERRRGWGSDVHIWITYDDARGRLWPEIDPLQGGRSEREDRVDAELA